jgi:hypothetical protein
MLGVSTARSAGILARGQVQRLVQGDRVAFVLPPAGLTDPAREETQALRVLEVDVDAGAIVAPAVRTTQTVSLAYWNLTVMMLEEISAPANDSQG